MRKMFTKKRIFVGLVVLSCLYAGFAATVPNPSPDKPLTTCQKIAKYIKPKVVDKALDKVRDKVADLIMYEGGKWIGGPFRGGDKDTTRGLVELVLDPRNWKQAPYKAAVTVLKPTNTVDQLGDIPGADPATQSSRLPVLGNTNQGSNTVAPSSPDVSPNHDISPSHEVSSHASERPDHEFAREHTDVLHGLPDNASVGVKQMDVANAPTHQESVKQTGSSIPSQHQTVSGGQPAFQPQQPLVMAGEGHFVPDPQIQTPQKSLPAASPAQVAAPIQAVPSRSNDHIGPVHEGPASDAHEIFHDHDKSDHNTPGGRDVSGVS
jgi:hypothetical protein